METDSCTTCGVSSSSIAEDRSRIKDLESKLAGLIQYGRDANKEFERQMETLRGQNVIAIVELNRCKLALDCERYNIGRLTPQWQRQLHIAERDKLDLKAQLSDLRLFINKINLETDRHGKTVTMSADELWADLYSAKDEIQNLRRETHLLLGPDRIARMTENVVEAEDTATVLTASEDVN